MFPEDIPTDRGALAKLYSEQIIQRLKREMKLAEEELRKISYPTLVKIQEFLSKGKTTATKCSIWNLE